MKFPAILFPVIALSISFAQQTASAQILGSGDTWSIRGTDPIKIYYGDKHVTSYESGYEAGKPYFYPIIGPTGENLTRHWPMKASQTLYRGMASPFRIPQQRLASSLVA